MILFTAVELWPLVELVREAYLPKLRRKLATRQVELERAASVALAAPAAAPPPPPPALAGIELVQHQGALLPTAPPPPPQGGGAVVDHANDLVEVRLRMKLEDALLFVVGSKDTANLMSWM
jgi:hypothetical protein